MKLAYAVLAVLLLPCLTVEAQVRMPEPTRQSGDAVTGAFEGWFANSDGTFTLLFGYFNRNRNQAVDIPIGPDNRIEPAGPDRGQPTLFLPGRGWGVLAVKVPADFGQNKITWTLISNGKTAVVPGTLKPDYEVSPFTEASVGNTPPVIRLEENGPSVQGPQGMVVERTAKVGTPLSVTAWVTDDAKFVSNSGARPKVLPSPVILHWVQYRGPAPVAFSTLTPPVEAMATTPLFRGKSTVEVTFTQPGDYTLEVQANDYSGIGGRGFQCCWSNAQVHVNVQP